MSKTSKRQRKIGICDIENACGDTCYNIWVSMIGRCYTTNTRPRDKSYIGCEVCQDWLTYSNFHNWFYDPNNGYVKGYNLDKDIISKGNKIYSPSTCCFIPQELNKVFTKRKSRRKVYSFFKQLFGITAIENTSIAYLRDKLLQNLSGQYKMTYQLQRALLTKCWNDYTKGAQHKVLLWNADKEPMPEFI